MTVGGTDVITEDKKNKKGRGESRRRGRGSSGRVGITRQSGSQTVSDAHRLKAFLLLLCCLRGTTATATAATATIGDVSIVGIAVVGTIVG